MTIPRTLRTIKKNYTLQTFLWALALSCLIFLPWMILDSGYFFFYGDFNVQQIPFYQMIHDSIREGNLGWSYTTDLGANIIGSYSFYNIGSPFFYLTLLLPSEAVPYMMAPLLMLKFALASTGAYLFLRRYILRQRFAMFGALLYAFSGFGIYNIFFNHFHEAMVIFPFILAALDAFVYEQRKGVLGLTLFLSAFMNYYFFAGQAVFLLIYWGFRMVTKSYRMTLIEFLRMVLEVILGVLCAGVVLVPSVFAVLQNNRVNNFPHGWNAVVYGNPQRYLHIFLSFFFPPDMPAYANFTPDSNAKWASVAAWLPLFSTVGVFAFYRLKTQVWLKKLMVTLFVMAMVPFFNAAFQLMNASYYARWYYMFTLMMALATAISLDRTQTDYVPALRRTFLVTAAITALIGLVPKNALDDKKNELELGLMKYPDRFWGWVAIAFVGLVTLTVLLCLRKNRKVFRRSVSIALSVLIVGYGNVLVGVGVLNSNYRKDFIADHVIDNRGVFNKSLPDIENVRSDFYETMDNMGMFWQVPTIQAFQSIVPGSIMDYYESIGVERSVGSRPKTDVYGIRSFLSVKYLFDYTKDSKRFSKSLGQNEMPGWTEIMEKNDFLVYENDYYIPYGFTYDDYISTDEYNDSAKNNRHLLMLKAIVLTDEQILRHGDILHHHSSAEPYEFTRYAYFEDCEKRRENTCEPIKFENSRFSTRFTAGDQDELVFFSIPYEDGWSAQVNGKAAMIERVNVGFMAVRVPKNTTSDIVFEYKTPGLTMGAVISAAGIVLFILYWVIWKEPAKMRRRKVYLRYYEDDSDSLPEELPEEDPNDFWDDLPPADDLQRPHPEELPPEETAPVEPPETDESSSTPPEPPAETGGAEPEKPE